MTKSPFSPFNSKLTRSLSVLRPVTAELVLSLSPKQEKRVQTYLKSLNFKGEQGFAYIPDMNGKIIEIWVGCKDLNDIWALAHCAYQLPEGIYQLDSDFLANQSEHQILQVLLGFALGSYKFNRYKSYDRKPAQLMLPKKINFKELLNLYHATILVRDLINTPTQDLHPLDLANCAAEIAKKYRASFKLIKDKDLIKNNYPCVYTVGQASNHPSCLIDFKWGHNKHPKVTLVGKGVCFDSGGLDLKSSTNMLLMKKDMGGAAHVLGLAHIIMEQNLPVRLRVLIPAVENVISGNAYKPGDVIKTRKGLTVFACNHKTKFLQSSAFSVSH